MSSYSKGCANDVIDDFHVITETASRPRWQCGHCTRLSKSFISLVDFNLFLYFLLIRRS